MLDMIAALFFDAGRALVLYFGINARLFVVVGCFFFVFVVSFDHAHGFVASFTVIAVFFMIQLIDRSRESKKRTKGTLDRRF